MHIFRQEIWCIENCGADSILRMEVLTIRDVFILNFAPVSLSVSPPGPREFVMHFNSRRQIIAVLVRLRHKIWVACKAKSAPLPKNWLEASTAHGTLFTSSPRSQHSGSSKSSHLRNASNVSALVVNILWKGDLWYVEFYTNMLYNYACLFSGNKCSAETHT